MVLVAPRQQIPLADDTLALVAWYCQPAESTFTMTTLTTGRTTRIKATVSTEELEVLQQWANDRELELSVIDPNVPPARDRFIKLTVSEAEEQELINWAKRRRLPLAVAIRSHCLQSADADKLSP